MMAGTNRRVIQVCKLKKLMMAAAVLLLPAVLYANPSLESRPIRDIAVVGMISVAFAVEILVTTLIVVSLAQIERRLMLVVTLVLLNAATFCVFILFLQPRLGSTIITEMMVWVTEAGALLPLTRVLGELPLSFRPALAVAFVGNLLSFLVGLAL